MWCLGCKTQFEMRVIWLDLYLSMIVQEISEIWTNICMKGMMIEIVCLWSVSIETIDRTLDPAFRFSVKSFDNGLMKMGSETTNSM